MAQGPSISKVRLIDSAGVNQAKINAGGDVTTSITTPNAAALGMFAYLNPYGSQRVTVEPTIVFYDPFDGSVVDVTNRWASAGTQVPTQANGLLTIAPTVGASVANNATLISQPIFTNPGLGFLTLGGTVTLEAAQTNTVNVHRFWGKGQVTSYAYATPVTDGIGFEVEGTSGALQCVIYVGGTKYVINSTTAANVSSSIPGAGGSGTALPSGATGSNYGKPLTWQGGNHRYALMIRPDVIYWYIEGIEVPVAVLSYVQPNVHSMPIRFASITNGAATSLANTFQIGAFAVTDTTAQNNTISDPTYPWRRATVKPGSSAAYLTDPSLVVSLHPSSPTPAGTNIIGSVNLTDPTNPTDKASVDPVGELAAAQAPASMFYENFNAALDTVNKWTITGTGPTVASGVGTWPTATATTSIITSIPTFSVGSSQYIVPGYVIKVEATVATGLGRFWGFGSVPSSPAVNSLAQEGAGFQIDSVAGAFQAVTYTGGVKTVIATLTLPTDGLYHRYTLYYRNSKTVWVQDGVIVATSTFLNMQLQDLPTQVAQVTSGTIVGTPVFVDTGMGVADNSRLASQIADGTYGWRKATVKPASTAVAATDTALGVGLHPSSPLPAGTNNIGATSLTSPNASALGIYAYLNPYGAQRVSGEPTPQFFDPFDGSVVDVTNRWTTSGTQVPTQANGALIIAATVGASVNNSSVIISQPTFLSPGIGFLTFGCTVTLEAAQTANVNVHRFFGKGQVTSYAYATPVTDGVGFEVEGTSGALQCVVYVGGTKYVVNSTTAANISSSVAGAGGSGTAFPTGASGSNYGKPLTWLGGQHRYAIVKRSDVIYWYAEGIELPVAVLAYNSPNVQTLPIRMAAITNGSATSLAYTFSVGAVTVADTTAQNATISDPTYQWRRMAISAAGAIVEKKDTGRTSVSISANAPTTALAAVAGTETLLPLQYSKALAADTTNVTTYAVAAGKTLRVQSISFTARAMAATATAITVTIRAAVSGAIATNSPVVWAGTLSVPATITAATSLVADLPDGFELPAAANIGITYNQTTASVIALSANLVGFEY